MKMIVTSMIVILLMTSIGYAAGKYHTCPSACNSQQKIFCEDGKISACEGTTCVCDDVC